MDNSTFKEKLKIVFLDKKKFATLSNTSYETVKGWKRKGKKIPGWVDSWIENYKTKIELKELKKRIKEEVIGEK